MPRGLILLVDDDDDFSDALADLLRDFGFGVVRVRHGREALAWLEGRTVPDVILLDLMMPVMDGYEFRERQLQNASLAAIPVVVLTAGALGEKAHRLGAECLRKPFAIELLLEAVERCASKSPVHP